VGAELLIIDPQNDFCVDSAPLCVPGAMEDMERLAKMIDRCGEKFDDIHVTLDTHHRLDISHPQMWLDKNGNHPPLTPPFAVISSEAMENGDWRPRFRQWYDRILAYEKALEVNGRYPHVVWPEHCLVTTPGHNVVECLRGPLYNWEGQPAQVDYVTKGSNMWTEHYSAVQADVPDPQDHTTQLNTRLITTLERADIVYLSGEALNFCLANTGLDIANNFGADHVKKLHLLEDATSPVPGFDQLTDAFMNDMIGRGMQVTTTDKVFA